MEPCPFEDAFPNIDTESVHKKWGSGGSGLPFVGGTDSKATREERRAAKKKAKRCKIAPAEDHWNTVFDSSPDPDRPAVQRMASVASLDAQKESFGGLPVLPKASCLFSDAGTPSYFGSDADEEEGYASFSGVVSDDAGYRLEPDATKSFELKGAEKPAGLLLPEPNLNDSWKPMAPAASYTAYLNDLPTAGSAVPGWAMDVSSRRAPGPLEAAAEVIEPRPVAQLPPPPAVPSAVAAPVVPAGGNSKEDRDMLLARIDTLMGRLEQLEKTKKQDTQTEILLFVGTGLFLLFSFDLVSRR